MGGRREEERENWTRHKLNQSRSTVRLAWAGLAFCAVTPVTELNDWVAKSPLTATEGCRCAPAVPWAAQKATHRDPWALVSCLLAGKSTFICSCSRAQ